MMARLQCYLDPTSPHRLKNKKKSKFDQPPPPLSKRSRSAHVLGGKQFCFAIKTYNFTENYAIIHMLYDIVDGKKKTGITARVSISLGYIFDTMVNKLEKKYVSGFGCYFTALPIFPSARVFQA